MSDTKKWHENIPLNGVLCKEKISGHIVRIMKKSEYYDGLVLDDCFRENLFDIDELTPLTLSEIQDFMPHEPQQPDPHAELKLQYARDVETCKTIDGLEAYQLWQYRVKGFMQWVTGYYPDFAIRDDNCEYRRHTHADSMIEYHRCSDEDKQRWQYQYRDAWIDCDGKPDWYEHTPAFRLKPRTITINGKEYNAPLNKLPAQKGHINFWYLDENYRPKRIRYEELNAEVFECYFREHRIFTKLEDCQAVADAFAEILASAK